MIWSELSGFTFVLWDSCLFSALSQVNTCVCVCVCVCVCSGEGVGRALSSGGSHTLTYVNRSSILPFIRAYRFVCSSPAQPFRCPFVSIVGSFGTEWYDLLKASPVHAGPALVCMRAGAPRLSRCIDLVLLIFEVIPTISYPLLSKRSVLLSPGQFWHRPKPASLKLHWGCPPACLPQ